MVLALSLLIACWVVIALAAAYSFVLVGRAAEALDAEEFTLSAKATALLITKIILHLVGWTLPGTARVDTASLGVGRCLPQRPASRDPGPPSPG